MSSDKKKEKNFWQSFHGYKSPSEVPNAVRRLNYKEEDIYDMHLAWIVKRIQSIEILDLDNTCVTSEGLLELLKLQELKELSLKGLSNIGDEAISNLAIIPSLSFLHLGGTSVTLEGLKGLKESEHLTEVILSSTTWTDEEIEKLELALPNVEVFVNRN